MVRPETVAVIVLASPPGYESGGQLRSGCQAIEAIRRSCDIWLHEHEDSAAVRSDIGAPRPIGEIRRCFQRDVRPRRADACYDQSTRRLGRNACDAWHADSGIEVQLQCEV